MKIDLAALARQAGFRRATFLPKPIAPPDTLRDDLARIYLEALREWAVIARDEIIPAYRAGLAAAALTRDDVQGSEFAASSGDASMTRVLLTLTPKLRRWVVRVEEWQRRRWAASIQPTGVKLETLIGPADVRTTVEATLQANIALVRNVSDEARSRMAVIVFRGFQARTPTREVARQISDALAMGRKRSLRIAGDQLQKLSATLADERRRQAGIVDWIWRHSHKAHPRPAHVERDGIEYSDRKSPPDMPGELPFCGCKQQPVLKL